MSNLANSYIQSLKPYKPPLDGRGTYPGILLDFNERTIPTSPKVEQALRRCVQEQVYRRYPEYSGELEKQLIQYLGEPSLTPAHILLTNGGDQAVDVAFRTFTTAGDDVIIPRPSFAMFYQVAAMTGNNIVEVFYNEDLTFPTAAILAAITSTTKLIVLCSPNNPTGSLIPQTTIEAILQAAPQAVLLLDEAYAEFSGVSAVALIKRYSNLMILRSFSKPFGLAGLRLGYLISNPELITEMLKVRGPYDVNVLAYAAASAALEDWPTTYKYIREVMEEAKPLVEQFFTTHHIQFYPSHSNFILFKPPQAAVVAEQLNSLGFRLRPQNQPGAEGTLRVTVGTVAQMQQFIAVYKNKIL